MANQQIVRITPFHYIHVEDKNTFITRVEVVPQIFIKKENEFLIFAEPKRMINLTPMSYCQIRNPTLRDANGKNVFTESGEATLNRGETEYRFYESFNRPFPLYPGEELIGEIQN
jgi:major vault protein